MQGHAPPSVRKTPGEPGAWMFLLGDMVVFGVFFTTFMVARSAQPDVFEAGRAGLHPAIGFVNTLVLLTSSLAVVVGVNALQLARNQLAARSFGVAVALGVTFIALKSFEYRLVLDAGIAPGDSDFYLYYFALTGLHLLHVVVGVGVLSLLLLQTRRSAFSATRMAVIESGGCFWHLVDLLWIVLFPLLYLVS